MVKPTMKKKTSKTRSTAGGTLIGLVIGLLVGLGVALAVAVYVTRVPIPFVDRNVSRNADQDALEAERNKGWNPNRSLGGAAAPAAPAVVVPAAPEAPGAIIVPPAAESPAATPPAATAPAGRPATGADPLGDLAQSRLGQPKPAAAPAAGPAAPAAPAAPGADPFTYFVQAGAFRTPEDAESQRARLAMIGIDAQVSEREQSGRTVFRVRVGPFNQKALADMTQEQLQNNGVEAALVRVQR
jgi:cell division protein FtsN